jgi:streptogramin lyase
MLALALVILSGFAFYEEYYTAPSSSCAPIRGGTFVKSHVTNTTFGGITEWALPSQGRWPMAVTTAPDGSAWFAEEEVPGVAHFYPKNGTLVEYAWTGYPTPRTPDCLYSASSSGIALWNGRVWAADEFGDAIIGVRPGDGSVVRINTTSNAAYPYWLAVGPDGNLWLTSDNTPPALGRIFPNLTLSIIKLEGLPQESPIQLNFVNSSLALLSTVNEGENLTSKTCLCTGHVYSFDPSRVSSGITPVAVGGGFKLILPTSVAYSDGRIWVAQHGPSSIASYDIASGAWTKYPTSTVPWSTTLPLVIMANGSEVWFNEHYANKIAVLDGGTQTLVEYSESNPPASSGAGVQNDESIALANGGIWFTSFSGNYVGFLSASYRPSFQVIAGTSDSVTVAPGGMASITLKVSGSWSNPMGVNISDSENYRSIPTLIHVAPSVQAIPAGSSPYNLGVTILVGQSVAPGNYTVTVTVTNGDIQESTFIFVDVK